MASRYTVGAELTANSSRFVRGFQRASASVELLHKQLQRINGAMARQNTMFASSAMSNPMMIAGLDRMNKQMNGVANASSKANRGISATNTATRNFARTAGAAAAGTSMMKQDLDRFNRTARGVSMTVLAMGAATYGAVKKSVGTFGSYESALAGVKKTVDGTARQFRTMDVEFRKLNRTMPATYEEIAGVAEVAGQLGIERKNITKFTETMVRMGTSTNMSSEKAAVALARLSNILGTSVSDVDRFGSVIVHMGNNTATSEQEIVDMSLRLAGMGKILGLTEADVVALSSTMSALGIRAEQGGSAMSTMMSKISSEIARGTDRGKEWADVMGMSIGEVQKLFEEDAYGALIKMVEGLEKVKESGGNVDKTLRDLGISEIRQLDVMKRLIGSSEDLAGAQNMANKEWQDNTALINESNERYKTFESQVQMLANGINNSWANMGAAIAKSSGGIIEKVRQVIDNVEKMTDKFLDAEGNITASGEKFAGFAKNALIAVGVMSALAASFFMFGPAGPAVVAITGGLGLLGKVAYELYNDLTGNRSLESAFNRIGSQSSEASQEAANNFAQLRESIYENMKQIQLETGPAAEKTREEIVSQFRQMHQEIRALNDEEQASMIAMVEQRMKTATGKELEALKQLKNQIIQDYDDLDARLTQHIESLSKDMNNIVSENGKINLDVLNSVAESAEKIDKIAGTSMSNSISKLNEYAQTLGTTKIEEMSATDIRKQLKGATESAADSLIETTKAYKEQTEAIEASNLTDSAKKDMLAMVDQEYNNTRLGVLEYLDALVLSAEEQGVNLESLGNLSDEQREALGIVRELGDETDFMSNAFKNNTLYIGEFKDAVDDARVKTQKANELWAETTEELSKMGEKFGTIPDQITQVQEGSSRAAESLGKAISTATDSGLRTVNLGESGEVLMSDFIDGLKSGEYKAEDVGLALVNKLRIAIGQEPLTSEGLKKMDEFTGGLKSGETSVKEFASSLGLSLKNGMEVNLGPAGNVSVETFVKGLKSGEYGATEFALVLTDKIASLLETDLSEVGAEDMNSLVTGLQSGLISVKDVTTAFEGQIKSDAKVELGEQGSYTMETLIKGLESGKLNVQDVMEGLKAMIEGESKVDLTSEAQDAMETYSQGISESSGIPVEEVRAMIQQMYETTGEVDFTQFGVEIPQETQDGINQSAPSLFQTITDLIDGVEEQMGETTDGGGGENAGSLFNAGFINWLPRIVASVTGGRQEVEETLGSTTDGAGGAAVGALFRGGLDSSLPQAESAASAGSALVENTLGKTTDGQGGLASMRAFSSNILSEGAKVTSTVMNVREKVQNTLGSTTDGKGGHKAGTQFNAGITTGGAKALATASKASNNVTNTLGKTTDGKGGTKTGQQFNTGLTSHVGGILSTANRIQSNVRNTLSRSTDGNGGRRVGQLFTSGINSFVGSAGAAGRSMSANARSGVSANTNTYGLGQNFGSGFVNGIRSYIGAAINAAVSLARAALNAVKSAQRSASPSKETMALGSHFGQGFALAIEKSSSDAAKSAKSLAHNAMDALDAEMARGYKVDLNQAFNGKELGKNMSREVNASANLDYAKSVDVNVHNTFQVNGKDFKTLSTMISEEINNQERRRNSFSF